jgi:hypothetical protein
VNETERYLADLAAELRTTGRLRRRFLEECAGHLADAAAEHGEHAAVARFGPAAQVAAALDAETATRRGLRATALAAAAVGTTAFSTLALIHSATPGPTAPALLAALFFVSAQVSAVAVTCAVVQAVAHRRERLSPPSLALLARRNAAALVAAGLTMFAAGAALPGKGSPAALLAGPLLALAALVAVARARQLARRLPGGRARVAHSPVADVFGLPLPAVVVRLVAWLDPVRYPARGCAVVAALAALGALERDLGEGASFAGASATGLVELAAVVACFAALGPALGLRAGRRC